MTVVVDVGCYDHPSHQGEPQDSVRLLIDLLKPRVLIGFDPHPEQRDVEEQRGDTKVSLTRAAAWTRDEPVALDVNGLSTTVQATAGITFGWTLAPGFDFAEFLHDLYQHDLYPGEDVVVKLDCEGAEYPILQHLIATRTDGLPGLALLVEWHDLPARAEERDRLKAAIRCPVGEWL